MSFTVIEIEVEPWNFSDVGDGLVMYVSWNRWSQFSPGIASRRPNRSEAPSDTCANRRHRHNPLDSLSAEHHACVSEGGEPRTQGHQDAAAYEQSPGRVCNWRG